MARKGLTVAWLAVPLCGVTTVGCVAAGSQYVEAGRAEYEASCAVCHGPEARGDGPMADLMTVPTPDLTTLALRHGGTFPFGYALETIDGRKVVRAHGSAMPIWGNRFAAQDMTQGAPREAAVERALGRLLALVMYLETLQHQP